MKFLCVSDQIDPLVYSSTIKERYSDIDAVFCAGDIPMEYIDFIVDSLGKPTFFIFGNHDLKEYKYYKKTSFVSPLSLKTEEDTMKEGHGADYVSNRHIREKHLMLEKRLFKKFFKKEKEALIKKTPLLVCGVTGSAKYNNGQAQFTENQMRLQLLALVPGLVWNKIRYGRYCDVFLTHASPRHVHDKEDLCHRGFKCFNSFIKRFHPTIMIHGHIHLYDLNEERLTNVEKTAVVNAYSHVVLEVKEKFNEGEKSESIVSILKDR